MNTMNAIIKAYPNPGPNPNPDPDPNADSVTPIQAACLVKKSRKAKAGSSNVNWKKQFTGGKEDSLSPALAFAGPV
jgi:hypothetical protein